MGCKVRVVGHSGISVGGEANPTALWLSTVLFCSFWSSSVASSSFCQRQIPVTWVNHVLFFGDTHRGCCNSPSAQLCSSRLAVELMKMLSDSTTMSLTAAF